MRFTEEQIIAVMRKQETGKKADDLTCKQGISEVTIKSWKAKFGGMDVSDVERLAYLVMATLHPEPVPSLLQSPSAL